jgi:hypothetical protein
VLQRASGDRWTNSREQLRNTAVITNPDTELCSPRICKSDRISHRPGYSLHPRRHSVRVQKKSHLAFCKSMDFNPPADRPRANEIKQVCEKGQACRRCAVGHQLERAAISAATSALSFGLSLMQTFPAALPCLVPRLRKALHLGLQVLDRDRAAVRDDPAALLAALKDYKGSDGRTYPMFRRSTRRSIRQRLALAPRPCPSR